MGNPRLEAWPRVRVLAPSRDLRMSIRKRYGFMTERRDRRLVTELTFNEWRHWRRARARFGPNVDFTDEKSMNAETHYRNSLFNTALFSLISSLVVMIMDAEITDAQILGAFRQWYRHDAQWIVDIRRMVYTPEAIWKAMQSDDPDEMFSMILDEMGIRDDGEEGDTDNLMTLMFQMLGAVVRRIDGDIVPTYNKSECRTAYRAEIGWPAWEKVDGEWQIVDLNYIRQGTYTAWERDMCIGNHPNEQVAWMCDAYGSTCNTSGGGLSAKRHGHMEWNWDAQKCIIDKSYCDWKGMRSRRTHKVQGADGKTYDSHECAPTAGTEACNFLAPLGALYCNLGPNTLTCMDNKRPVSEVESHPRYPGR